MERDRKPRGATGEFEKEIRTSRMKIRPPCFAVKGQLGARGCERGKRDV
jgi:hypothetical protein